MIPNLASFLDFANHHANATPEEIKQLCRGVLEHGFNSAFVNPVYVPLAHELLAGRAKVGAAISFPLGGETRSTKVASCLEAVRSGADELDVVPNLALLLGDSSGQAFLEELREIVEAVKQTKGGTIVKFILETGYLTPEQIKLGAKMVADAGADFVKFTTGMGPRGASLADLALVKEAVAGRVKIKVSGGIDTYEEAEAFINAGANRIGTSHAIEIIKEVPAPVATIQGSAE
ncbi:MAG: deoxyribose-phosphate aldolase [Patescibacteria group bacterium]